MKREEAARVLEKKVEVWEGVLKHMLPAGDSSELKQIEDYETALRMGAAALRKPARKPCGWCNDGVMQIVDSPNKPPIRSNYCGLCGRKLTAPPRPGAIGPDAGETAPNGDEGAEL